MIFKSSTPKSQAGICLKSSFLGPEILSSYGWMGPMNLHFLQPPQGDSLASCSRTTTRETLSEGTEISCFNLIPLQFFLVSIGILCSSRTGWFTLYLPQNERTKRTKFRTILPSRYVMWVTCVISNFIIVPSKKKVAEI